MLFVVDGAEDAMRGVLVSGVPTVEVPVVTRVLTSETSAEGAAVPPLPSLPVLFSIFGSDSTAVAVAVLPNAPAAVILAVTLMVTFAPEARLPRVHGKAAQPPPVTFVMVMFVGVSVTWMLVAVDGPALATTRV